MNDDRDLERKVSSTYVEIAPAREPHGLLDNVLLTTGQTRQRPAWLAYLKEPPMRHSSQLAVGSPTFRIAAIMVATLLIALIAAGAGIAGSRLLAAAGPIVVAQDGSGDYATINAALAVAGDGDVIMLKPGTYAESLAIDKAITLQGDGPVADIIIQFDEDSPTVESDLSDNAGARVSLPYAIRLDDSGAILSGFTIKGPAVGYGIRISGGAPTIAGVVIELADQPQDPEFNGDGAAPLWFGSGSTASVTGSSWNGYVGVRRASPTIENNTISGAISINGPGQPIVRDNRFLAGSGVNMSEGGSPLIEGNDFEDGSISVDTGADPTIRGNVIHRSSCFDCGAISINQYTWDPASENYPPDAVDPEELASITAVVEDNQVRGASKGISVIGHGALPTVRENVVEDSEFGILIQNTDPVVQGNTIRGGTVGLMVTGGAPVLTDNTIEGVAGRGLVLGGGSQPTLSGNTSCGNETNLWQPANVDAISTEGNTICEDAPAE